MLLNFYEATHKGFLEHSEINVKDSEVSNNSQLG